jgi:hypothetical protein
LDRNIGDIEASGSHPRRSFGEEDRAWGVGPLGVSGSVVAPKITETRGTQQSIAGSMGDDITIGVPVRTYFVIEEQTCNVHRPTKRQPMNVDANSGATRG